MNLFSNCTRLAPSNLLQTGDAKEDSKKFVGCREENCVITIRNVKHLLGWVSGDDEILVGSEDSQVFPCPNVIAVHLSELGRSEWQNLRARTIRSWCHHYSRQIHILQQSQQHSKPYLNECTGIMRCMGFKHNLSCIINDYVRFSRLHN